MMLSGLERFLDTWPVARLATIRPDGRPHLVPIVFAPAVGALWSPIDGKPKGAGPVARVRNIEHEPRVSLLIDHYDEEWRRLWWLRIDGLATLVHGDAAAEAALRAKYPQYREVPLYADEPLLIRIAPTEVTRWGRDE
jgi:PPOX class probable F420-dependent enzyme